MLFGIARSTHTIIYFGMSMVSLENTRDQWNNPLVSGLQPSQAAFSGFPSYRSHAAKIVINSKHCIKQPKKLAFLSIKIAISSK